MYSKITIFSLLILSFASILWGLFVLIFDTEINRCAMTFMWQRPAFYIVYQNKSDVNSAQYTLYDYNEGLNKRRNEYSGLPVLYLTGNLGSYKTVRSLSSVALRMHQSRQTSFEFDYFTIDQNEEPSAFSGDFIESQTKFAYESFKHIQQLYENRPKITLIAHSMGAVVYFNLIAQYPEIRDHVNLLIVLAAPLSIPALSIGHKTDLIYDRIQDFIANAYNNEFPIISITCGSRDLQVWDSLGQISALNPSQNILWMDTPSTRQVWASCDHLCIVWCKQLILLINRILFAMVNKETSSLDRPTTQITSYFRSKFTTKRLFLIDSVSTDSYINISPSKSVWFSLEGRLSVFQELPISSYNNDLFVKIGPFSKDLKVFILVDDVASEEWLFNCVDSDKCLKLQSIIGACSADSCSQVTAPGNQDAALRTRGLAFLSNSHDNQIFALNLRPNEQAPRISILIDSFDDIDSRVIRDPGVRASFWPLQQTNFLNIKRNINQDQPASFYRIYFPLSKFLFGPALPAVRIDVRATHCKKIHGSFGMANFHSPWNGGFYHFPLKYSRLVTSINLQVNKLPPANFSLDPYVDFVLEPTCEYQLNLYYSLPHWFGQLLRLHGTHAGCIVCGHLLLSLLLLVSSALSTLAPTYNTGIIRLLLTQQERKGDDLTQLWIDLKRHLLVALFFVLLLLLFSSPNENPILGSSSWLESEWIYLQRFGQLGNHQQSFDYLPEAFVALSPLLVITLAVSLFAPFGLHLLLKAPLGLSLISITLGFLLRLHRWPRLAFQLWSWIGPLLAIVCSFLFSHSLGIAIIAFHLISKCTILSSMLLYMPSKLGKVPRFEFHMIVALILLLIATANSEDFVCLVNRFFRYLNACFTESQCPSMFHLLNFSPSLMVLCLATVSYLCGPWPVLVLSHRQATCSVNILQPIVTKARILNATLNLVPLLYAASFFCSIILFLGFFRTVLSLHRASNVLFWGVCLLTLALTQFGLLIPRMDKECDQHQLKSLRSRLLCRLDVLVPLAKFKSL